MASKEDVEEVNGQSMLNNRCFMSGCRNNRLIKYKGIPMFPFPKNNLNLAKFWLGICNRQPYECPFHGQAVCTDHFRTEDVLTDRTGILLKPNVVPTAKIPNICYSILLEFLKQTKNGGSLDANKIGVDFSCAQNCTFSRPNSKKPASLPTILNYGNLKKPSTSKDLGSGGIRIALKRIAADGTEEVQTGPKIFIIAKSKPTESNEADSNVQMKTTAFKNPNLPCKIVQRKIVSIPSEIQSRISQVIKHMTQIIQDFMAFQIYITHLEQAVVCANEKISCHLTEAKSEIEPKYYKKFQGLSNFLLLLYDIHGVRSSDVISHCTKIWRRIMDCHQELKIGGKLKVFITAANGCLVTIVKAIDAISMLKSVWKNLAYKVDGYGWLDDYDESGTLNTLINEHIEDATVKLEAVDVEIQLTRQKILDIKNPAVRILEVSQMDVDGDMIYIKEQPVEEGKKENIVLSLVPNPIEKSVRKSSTIELGEIIEDDEPLVTNQISLQPKPTEPTPAPAEIIPHETPPMQISAPTTITNNFHQTPSLTYPTMSTLPMQAQLIPTIQVDAFGNQSVVYQLTYQQVTQNIPSGLTAQPIQNSLNTPLAGFVIPGYNPNGSSFHVTNHQTSPTLLATNTSQQLLPPQENTNVQVPLHYATIVEEKENDQVIVVKAEPGTIEIEDNNIKEEPNVGQVITKIDDDTYIKHEPEWNEETNE